MAAGDTLRRITPSDQLILNAAGQVVGIKGGTANGGDLYFDPALASLQARMRNRSKRGHKSLGGYWATMTSPGYDGRTMQTITVAECPFMAVRLKIRNAEAAGFTLNASAVAASANASSVNPTTGAAGWVPVTWGGASSIAIPARTTATRPSITTSDWISLQSVARNDGGSLPILYMRGYNVTGPKTGMVGSTITANGWRTVSGDAKTRDRFIITDSAAGDFASGSFASFTGDSGSFGTFLYEFEYLATSDVLTVMGVGDSITQGDGGSIALYSWGHIACTSISSTLKPVQWSNHGASNQTSSNFYDRLSDIIAGGARPQIVVFSPGTPNDGTPTAAVLAAQLGNMAKAIDLCESNGILPIIWTSIPRSWGTSDDVYRQSLNTAIRALIGRGYLVADFDAAIAASPGSNAILPSLTSDVIHPNDAGNALLAAVMQPLLQKAADAYFTSTV